MSIDITIIGTGNMARALSTRALAAGKTLQILSRNPESAAALAAELGQGAVSGASTEAPAGAIVIPALPFDAAKEYVTAQGAALASKVLVDISNPVNFETFDSLMVQAGSSAAEEIAALTPASVVKAFNTTFAGPLTEGNQDVFMAGADDARAAVAGFATAAGLRPIEVGGLHHARELEGFQLLMMAAQVNPALADFNWNTSLKVTA